MHILALHIALTLICSQPQCYQELALKYVLVYLFYVVRSLNAYIGIKIPSQIVVYISRQIPDNIAVYCRSM